MALRPARFLTAHEERPRGVSPSGRRSLAGYSFSPGGRCALDAGFKGIDGLLNKTLHEHAAGLRLPLCGRPRRFGDFDCLGRAYSHYFVIYPMILGSQTESWEKVVKKLEPPSNAGMDWADRLEMRLKEKNYQAVSRRLGFSKNRLYAIVREKSVPNAIDAVKICRYVGASVEDIFGEDATKELSQVRPPTPEEADRAARKAWDITANEVRQETDASKAARKESSKAKDKNRKSG